MDGVDIVEHYFQWKQKKTLAVEIVSKMKQTFSSNNNRYNRCYRKKERKKKIDCIIKFTSI